jgi:hypothetical protein
MKNILAAYTTDRGVSLTIVWRQVDWCMLNVWALKIMFTIRINITIFFNILQHFLN